MAHVGSPTPLAGGNRADIECAEQLLVTTATDDFQHPDAAQLAADRRRRVADRRAPGHPVRGEGDVIPRPPSPSETQRGNAYLAPRTGPAAKIRRWQPFRNQAGTMLGFLSIELPSGLIINDAKLMVGPAGMPWIALPATKQLDRDGSPRLDANGRQMWSPVIEFADREAADKFRDLVLNALRRRHPEALEGMSA